MKTADRLLADAAYCAIVALSRTVRLTEEGLEQVAAARALGRPPLFLFWHNRLLYLGYLLAREGLVVMASRSRDGDLIARIAADHGIRAARGSTSRGGSSAARAMARAMREGGLAGGLTPDGPRGPRYRLQPGALLVARLSGAPIVPVAVGFSRRKEFGSWDGFLLPLPFARARVVYGEPFLVPADAGQAGLEAARVTIEERLTAVTERADRPFAGCMGGQT